jgi:hypothetical protein
VVAAEAEVQLLRRQARAAQESSEAMQLTCIQRERGREEVTESDRESISAQRVRAVRKFQVL